jgi:hypothetical protein
MDKTKSTRVLEYSSTSTRVLEYGSYHLLLIFEAYEYCDTGIPSTRVLEYSSTIQILPPELSRFCHHQRIPCERSELTSLRVRYYRPRRAAGSPSAQRYTPLAPHIIDTALGSPLAPHPAGNSIKYRNGCVGLMEVGRRLTDCWVLILNRKS